LFSSNITPGTTKTGPMGLQRRTGRVGRLLIESVITEELLANGFGTTLNARLNPQNISLSFRCCEALAGNGRRSALVLEEKGDVVALADPRFIRLDELTR
jgi:hypothetical protein